MKWTSTVSVGLSGWKSCCRDWRKEWKLRKRGQLYRLYREEGDGLHLQEDMEKRKIVCVHRGVGC